MTPAIKKACEAGIACCNDERLRVEYFEKLAEVEPAWKERAEELRSKLDHTEAVAQAGLMFMSELS